MIAKCPVCDAQLKDYRSKKCKSCSKKGNSNPMFNLLGKRNPLWKNGYINYAGYRVVRVNRKMYYQHRVIMETFLGRKLKPDEVIHHKNGNKLDNRIKNLELITQSIHVLIHKPRLGTGRK